MTDAWMWAQERALEHVRPTIEDVLFLAARIEPEENQNGFRTVNVWVGGHKGTEPTLVPHEVQRLWQDGEDITPDEFYLMFEAIHPFGDGNGRTGKVLHNWLLGTLDNPVLVFDYFGGGNP